MINGLGGRFPPIAAHAPVANAAAEATKARHGVPGVATPPAAARDGAAAATGDLPKIDRLRAAIAQGTYAIEPRMIAERIIATDLPKRSN